MNTENNEMPVSMYRRLQLIKYENHTTITGRADAFSTTSTWSTSADINGTNFHLFLFVAAVAAAGFGYFAYIICMRIYVDLLNC